MRLAGGVAAAVVLAGAAQAQVAPKVVATSPANGARVPPSVAELKVTYDHRMMDGHWGFATGGEKAFPEVEGTPSISDDHISFSLPIRLEPGRTYVVWLNTDRHMYFRGEDGVPAEPYRLTFSTTD